MHIWLYFFKVKTSANMKNNEFCLYIAKGNSHYSVFFSGNPVYLDSLCIACLFLYSLYTCYSFDHFSVNYKHTFWWLMHLKSLCFVAPHCCILGHSSHGIFIGRLMNARVPGNPVQGQHNWPSLCFWLDRVGVSITLLGLRNPELFVRFCKFAWVQGNLWIIHRESSTYYPKFSCSL